MSTTQQFVAPLYINAIRVNEANGYPEDFTSFSEQYRPLVIGIAKKMGIPENDLEDAIQEITLKFWDKDGLNMFDPGMRRKFSTFWGTWAGKFLLQERDKSYKLVKKHYMVDSGEFMTDTPTVEYDTNISGTRIAQSLLSADRGVISDVYISQWLNTAREALRAADRQDLIPVLDCCADAAESGSKVTQATIAKYVGCSPPKAAKLIGELRDTLTNSNLGVASFHD